MNQIVRAENQGSAGLSTVSEVDAETLARVVLNGDLTNLAPKDRVTYYNAVCRTVGLNPFTQPFEYLRLNNKLVLYAKRTCSDQLRQIYGVNLAITDKRVEDDLFIVTVQAVNARGRRDEDLGVVSIAGLKGEAKANAILKAITKGKRRVTLSICGLGIMDETEAVDVAGTQFGTVAADGQDVAASRPFIKQIARESVMPTLDLPAEREWVPAASDSLRAVAEQVQTPATDRQRQAADRLLARIAALGTEAELDALEADEAVRAGRARLRPELNVEIEDALAAAFDRVAGQGDDGAGGQPEGVAAAPEGETAEVAS